jgi:hypothetical protein
LKNDWLERVKRTMREICFFKDIMHCIIHGLHPMIKNFYKYI